ncbi:MAG: ABC transporter ATP-binding protein/permease [Christensenellaceae bacterium]|nr:ABC transporter ATP-binding protein/permease [Christensenellaceae bacterium]
MLRLTDVTKDYSIGDGGVVRALNGISLDFRKAELVAVLGPSGCGKTTLMNIIGGLDRATSGDILLNERSTKLFNDSDWDNYRNKKIGFIFQNYYLIPHLSVLSNVELALTIAGVSKTERTKRATEALTKVGLSDQLSKNPNQLSGGQMQRVAIARALVNNPEILLADEPTGALDTTTSSSIMELVKEISENKLVIMVTHNPELADKYSTRIIKMVDGQILDDNNPYNSLTDIKHRDAVEQERAEEKMCENKRLCKTVKKKTSMSFFTALFLSLKNLFTKKGRTILTAIAGSIGIIGVSLILAVSQGMDSYITKMQSDMLSSYPISISETAINTDQIMTAMNRNKESEDGKFPSSAIQKLFPKPDVNTRISLHTNNITQEYVDYLKNPKILNPALYNDMVFDAGVDKYFYGKAVGNDYYQRMTQGWMEMMNLSFIQTQYDLISIEGKLPEDTNELVLIVDEYNKVSERTLYNLGIIPLPVDDGETQRVAEVPFEDILSKEYKLVLNNGRYTYSKTKGYFETKTELEIDYDDEDETILTLKIVGVLRINTSTESGVLNTGIAYTKELSQYILEKNGESEIVEWMKDPANDLLNPFNGIKYEGTATGSGVRLPSDHHEAQLRALGGIELAKSITIYPKSFSSKEEIKIALDAYNDGKAEESQILYSDVSEMIIGMVGQLVDIITYVLIAFTAISLIVSSVMIAIITYVSVIERTKEIGILRSIGARKRDITRVFNAETFIIGFSSGAIGVIVAYLVSIPINIIIKSLTSISGIAALSPLTAVMMIGISIGLMVISGLIPAFMASRKDPVTALRSD